MLAPYSKDWYYAENGRIICPVDVSDSSRGCKYYEVRRHPVQGNPVIFQPCAGSVYLTVLGTRLIVCEMETFYDERMNEIAQYRVVRRSLHNPEQICVHEAIPLGEIYSNSQRVMGAPERLYLVHLAMPPDGKYVYRTAREVLQTRDGLGIVAVAKAIERGFLQLD